MSTPIFVDEGVEVCHEPDHVATLLILDISPAAYAEIRDQLRQQSHGASVGNKLIHLDRIILREREPNREGIGVLVFGGLLVGFVAFLTWAVIHMFLARQ
jgi:hypothetical protein